MARADIPRLPAPTVDHHGLRRRVAGARKRKTAWHLRQGGNVPPVATAPRSALLLRICPPGATPPAAAPCSAPAPSRGGRPQTPRTSPAESEGGGGDSAARGHRRRRRTQSHPSASRRLLAQSRRQTKRRGTIRSGRPGARASLMASRIALKNMSMWCVLCMSRSTSASISCASTKW